MWSSMEVELGIGRFAGVAASVAQKHVRCEKGMRHQTEVRGKTPLLTDKGAAIRETV